MSISQGKRNRRRGSDYEKEVERDLNRLGYRSARKTGSIQSNGGVNGRKIPDIAGIPGIWLSVKRYKRVLKLPNWWREAESCSPTGSVPAIIMRGDGKPSQFVCNLEDLPIIIAAFQESEKASRIMHHEG